jgi:DNA polymerase I-like protein with 3'-5' exonuclease and polymerase domains
MRDDLTGLFWDDSAIDRAGRTARVRTMPQIPDTGWLPPREFPNLSAARVIAVDTETKELDFDHGPGWARGQGHIVGVSLAADNGEGRWYFPVRHEVEPEFNMNPDHVFAYMRDALRNVHQPKVGANLVYDLGWLAEENVDVAGELVDVQHAEALLNERGESNLDFLGQKYCGLGKETSFLYQWCADFYGGSLDDQRKNIWRAPPRLVGPYAERDAVLPLLVAKQQYPILEREGLLNVLRMENGLIRLMVAMRRAGVTVDLERAEALRRKLLIMEQETQGKLDHIAGQHVEVSKSRSIARAFDAMGLKYPLTAAGAPSFKKDWLAAQTNPVADLVNEVRKLSKLRGTFIESYILNSHVNGRVYGQFHLLRSDDGGTRSGRLSSSTPNLQNVPARDKELAPLVRGMFIPDHGHKQWRRFDYSQIEYRFLVHFAQGPGSEEVRAQYHRDPDTDYHEYVIAMIMEITRILLDRKPAKNMNFGLIYGMGIPKLMRSLGLDKKKGEELFAAYHKAIPYAKAAMEESSQLAHAQGFVTTVLGRRSRFDLWEPNTHKRDEHVIALPYDMAIRHYGDIRRAHTHKALNRRLQGSAADLIKFAMWRCWEEGVFAVTGVPRLTVHDELDFSDAFGNDEAFAHMKHILETALPLRIPVRVDAECGPDWGNCA